MPQGICRDLESIEPDRALAPGACVCVMCIVYGTCVCQLQHRSLGPIPDLLIQISVCAEVEGCGGSPGACILQSRQVIPMCAKVGDSQREQLAGRGWH